MVAADERLPLVDDRCDYIHFGVADDLVQPRQEGRSFLRRHQPRKVTTSFPDIGTVQARHIVAKELKLQPLNCGLYYVAVNLLVENAEDEDKDRVIGINRR